MTKLTLKYLKEEPSLKHIIWLIGGAAIEFYSRALGWLDLKFKKANPKVWDIAESTRKVR
jgi:hypothetical protein